MTPVNQNQEIKKYVLTVIPSVCDANGKDPQAAALLETMKTYGKVEPLEKVIDAATVEYQQELGETRKMLTAIQDQQLTPDEIIFLAKYRELKIALEEKKDQEIEGYKTRLEEVRQDSLRRSNQLAELAQQIAAMSNG